MRDGLGHLVLDGMLIPIDRVRADRPFYSGKHKKHGMNIQVIASPDGSIVWVSGPLPGSVHDMKAAGIWSLVRELSKTKLRCCPHRAGHLAKAIHVLKTYEVCA
jgi:hypothetical protein